MLAGLSASDMPPKNGMHPEAWFVKLGAKRKSWKRRWFVAYGDEIVYYTGGCEGSSEWI